MAALPLGPYVLPVFFSSGASSVACSSREPVK